MIAYFVMAAALLAGCKWPGALMAGALFTYQASSLTNNEWVSPAYILLAALIALWHAVRIGTIWRVTRLDVAAIIMLLGCAIGSTYAPYPVKSAEAALQLLLSFGGMYAITRFSFRDLAKTLHEFLIASVAVGGALSLLLLFNRSTDARYAIRLYLENNMDATVVGLALPFPYALLASAILIYISRKPGILLLAMGSGIVTLYAALISSTRGVFAALAAGLIAFFFLSSPHLKFSRLSRFFIFAISGSSILPIFISKENITRSMERITRNFSGGSLTFHDTSSSERLYDYSLAVDIFRNAPFLGQGYGSFSQITGRNYPHNLFLEFMSELGIVGLILVTVWLGVLAIGTWRIYRQLPIAGAVLGAMIAAAFIHMQLSASFYMGRALFVFAALVAGSIALSAEAEFHRRSPPLQFPPKKKLRPLSSPPPV